MDRNGKAHLRWTLALAASALALLLLAALPLNGGWAAPPAASVTPTASGTLTATVDIGNATPVACGQAVAGNTTGAANNVSVYGCAPWWPETGPERVFALTVGAGSDVDALLNGLTSDLDLFLLTNSSPASCIAYGDHAVRVSALAAGTYYLVVDGFDSAAGAFQLNVWCPLQVTPSPSPTATATPTATPTATATPSVLRLYLPLLLQSAADR